MYIQKEHTSMPTSLKSEALRKQATDYRALVRTLECQATAMDYQIAAQRAEAQAQYWERRGQ
jgi:hypothetical protein